MGKKEVITFDSFMKKVKTYITNEEDLNLINKAYLFAFEKHFGQKRLTGEDYIIHSLTVATILTGINADTPTLCAGLLHDVLEDCNVTKEEMEEKFGKEITFLVDGVTKVNKLNLSGESESVIINQRKIFVGLSEDVRVIIIKLADRLHNMKTLFVHDEKTQKAKARETLDVLTPIAHRLGMNNIKTELEELSLRYLKPDEYYSISEKLNQTKAERDQNVADMIDAVSEILNKHGIVHEIKGRSKSIYSIYKKLDKGKRWNDIYDLLALRVFVDTEAECYQALGIIHSKFKPIPKRFKDYVAMPKTNMYQSLHTSVFGIGGQIFEIQIRTYEMDKIAEYGIASHWSYKEKGKANIQSEMEQKLQFFRSIMELRNTEENPEDFVKSVKEDILKNTIYVFTPQGDVIELPNGSTPIDFAYKVHSKVGDNMVGALVNETIAPLDHKLQSNDIVKIITNNNSTGPKKEWLEIAHTSQAKNKIKSFFNKQDKEEYLKKGEELLLKELRKRKISTNDFFEKEKFSKVLEEMKLGSKEEVYTLIGNNKLSVDSVIESANKEKVSMEDKILKKSKDISTHVKETKNIVSVNGIDTIKVNIASCCNPVKGDRIVGYITKGYGVTVHRMMCPNVSNLEERIIEVEWNDIDSKLPTNIIVRYTGDNDILLDIVTKVFNNNSSISNVKRTESKETHSLEITLLVESKESLLKIMNDIKMISSVNAVERLVR